MRRVSLIVLMILGAVAAIAMPVGHATNNVHTFYLGNSLVGTCSGKCESLLTSTGAADTGTSQHFGKNTGTYQVEPDIAGTATTGTPSASSISGYAWVYNTDLGGATIQSGTWNFDVTTSTNNSGGQVGSAWITVWNCTTNSLRSCTFLFKNWDNSTNVIANTSPTRFSYTTGSIGPFSNIHFISVEYWISVTTASSGSSSAVTETTVSSASDIITPGWNYARSLGGSLTLTSAFLEKTSIFKILSSALTPASTFAEKSSIFKSLSDSLTLPSSQGAKNSVFKTLTVSIMYMLKTIFTSTQGSKTTPVTCTVQVGAATACTVNPTGSATMASSLAVKNSVFLTLTGSFAPASGFTERTSLFRSFTSSLSLASSLAEKSSVFRSLSGSLGSDSNLAETSSIFRSFGGSLGLSGSETKGIAKSLSASFGESSGFVEHSSLFRSLTSALGLSSSELQGRTVTLSASIGSASSFTEHTSLFRSLTDSLGSATSSFRDRIVTLTASIGSNSSPAEHNSLFKSLTDALGLSGSERKGIAESLSTSLGQVSSSIEQSSFFRSFAGSIDLALGMAERSSLSMTLTSSVGFDGSQSKGFAGTLTISLGTTSSLADTPRITVVLQAGFNTTTPLSGQFDCSETLIGNCGSPSVLFVFPVILLGFLLFGIYAIRRRREHPGQ